jgi:membrane associated rhomboid family serine protease
VTPWVLPTHHREHRRLLLERTGTGIANLLAFVPSDALVRPWTLVTYMFVHASTSHIPVQHAARSISSAHVSRSVWGRGDSSRSTDLSGISGAILSMIFAPYAPIVGASGAVFGIMFAFAKFWPTAEIYIMGILPIQARIAVLLMAAAALWSGVQGSRGGVADFAHLGGFVGGWLYLKWLDRRAGIQTVPVEDRSLRSARKRCPTTSESIHPRSTR